MDQERMHREIMQRIRGFRLMDDEFMTACFDGNIEGTELLLRIILGRDDIRVKQVQTQRQMKNLVGRDVRLDIDAVDSEGREMDIESQRADGGAGRRRARYYSSILDAHLLKPGDTFDQLPETWIIFITENDVLEAGLPIYQIERQIVNLSKPFDDGEHILYVNGAARNDSTELGKLMQDFFCIDPDDMHFPELAEKARYYKQDEKGVEKLSRTMEEFGKIVADEAVWNEKVDTVLRCLDNGLPHETIARLTDLTVEQIKEIAGQRSA